MFGFILAVILFAVFIVYLAKNEEQRNKFFTMVLGLFCEHHCRSVDDVAKDIKETVSEDFDDVMKDVGKAKESLVKGFNDVVNDLNNNSVVIEVKDTISEAIKTTTGESTIVEGDKKTSEVIEIKISDVPKVSKRAQATLKENGFVLISDLEGNWDKVEKLKGVGKVTIEALRDAPKTLNIS